MRALTSTAFGATLRVPRPSSTPFYTWAPLETGDSGAGGGGERSGEAGGRWAGERDGSGDDAWPRSHRSLARGGAVLIMDTVLEACVDSA